MQARRWMLAQRRHRHAPARWRVSILPRWARCRGMRRRRCRSRSRCCRTGFRSTCTNSSSWARGTVFALMLLQATRPVVAGGLARGRARTLYPAAAFHQVHDAARPAAVLAAQLLLTSPTRRCALYDRHHLKRLRARAMRYAEKLDARSSGRQRLVGRNPALLPAERDGAQGAGLPQRPSGDRQGARGECAS